MRYTYLLCCLLLTGILGICLLVRRDLLKLALSMGAVGGLAGLAAEFFYFRDYWRPPSLFGTAKLSPEDFMFGFAITGLNVVLYAVVARKRLVKTDAPRRDQLFAVLLLCGLVLMVVGNLLLGINSIVVSSAMFLLFAVIMYWLRRDLIRAAVCTALLMVAIAIAGYALLFDWLFPDFWNDYWMLAHGPLGRTMLGNIPLTELMWYASWASFASISYPFVHGEAFRDVRG